MQLLLQNKNHLLLFAMLTVLAFALSACSQDDDDGASPPLVVIGSFTPTAGVPGTMVTIFGTGFGARGTDVKFNGKAASVTSASTNKLTVLIPNDATTGKITVTVNGLTASSTANFTVESPFAITEVSPASGVAGDTVIITGTDFGTTPADISVTINGSDADFEAASDTELRVIVPADATTGKIVVTVKGASVTAADDFTILAPTITSFTPTIGAENVSIMIMGTNFSEVLEENIVTFNGEAGTVTAATKTELTVTMPAGSTTGKVSVQVGPNTATSTQDLTVCNLPELLVAKFEMVSISANNKECSYKVTILNAGGQPLDMTKWVLQTNVAQNADGSNTLPAGGTQLDVIGTLESGQSYEYSNSSNTSEAFATYPYLMLDFQLKVGGSVTECSTENNTVIVPVIME